ncbi:MAG: hypothetical protein WED09_08350 [Homoserinimonas sp.]
MRSAKGSIPEGAGFGPYAAIVNTGTIVGAPDAAAPSLLVRERLSGSVVPNSHEMDHP